MLQLQPTAPEWLGALPGDEADPRPFLLPGVRVQFAPIGPKAFRAATMACIGVLEDGGDEPDNEEASDALARELIVRGILAWEGIGDAGGQPLAVSEGAKQAFIGDPRTFLAAEAVYVTPFLLRDAEKNGSAGSPDGIGAETTPAKDTASTARIKTRPAGVKAALTSKTNVRPRKRRASGRS